MGIAEGRRADGGARCPGTSWDDLAVLDKNPVPSFLRKDSYHFLGSDAVPVERYVTSEFHRREVERMWPRVWQFAARDEELLKPGQTVVYENAGRSYVLARQYDGSIRAFHNVCLHRNRKLVDKSGTAVDFRCPFHGFTWKIDGTLKSIPCRWDFEHLSGKNMSLPEAEVGRWQGYIFIREESGGPSIEEYLGPLVEHFEYWRHDECYTSAWAAQVIPANWKACAEAFMESFHVIATHPQIMPYTGDANSKYFIWGDHVNLALTPFGVTSPHMENETRGEQWIIDQFIKYNSRVVGPNAKITVPEEGTARRAMGEYNRKRFGEMVGRDFSGLSDSVVQDAYTYNVFPNFSPWGGFAPNIVYRWRPWPDQGHCLMEVRLLSRLKPGEPMRDAVPMIVLEPHESWERVFGQLGVVLMQDMGNLPAVQAGMEASKTGVINLANYQEVRIRHFHQTLDKYLAG